MTKELIDITPVVTAVIGVCITAITIYVVPWVRAKIKVATAEVEQAELDKIWKWMEIAIKAAEQLADQGRIPKSAKYQYVANVLAKHGFKLDEQDVEVLIEGFCHDLPKWLIEGIEGEIDETNPEESESSTLSEAELAGRSLMEMENETGDATEHTTPV